MNKQSRHDALRDAIARDWSLALQSGPPSVLSIICECGNSASDLPLDGARVVTEYTWGGIRADAAILNIANQPCRFLEIIDAGPPSKAKIRIYQEAGIPVVFIPFNSGREMRGYCSVRCWLGRKAMQTYVGREDSRVQGDTCDDVDVVSESLRWCEDCGVQLTAREAIGDCQGLWCANCIGTNVIHLCCWGRDPFNNGRWIDEHSTVAELLAYWNSTDFWRHVWNRRVREPCDPYGGLKDESLTASAIQFVASAISHRQFSMAYAQLLDIGYSPMTAFEPNNTFAIAKAWEQMEVHAESLLPSTFQITRRPANWER